MIFFSILTSVDSWKHLMLSKKNQLAAALCKPLSYFVRCLSNAKLKCQRLHTVRGEPRHTKNTYMYRIWKNKKIMTKQIHLKCATHFFGSGCELWIFTHHIVEAHGNVRLRRTKYSLQSIRKIAPWINERQLRITWSTGTAYILYRRLV